MDNYLNNENDEVINPPTLSDDQIKENPVETPATTTEAVNAASSAADYKKPRIIIAIVTAVIALVFLITGSVLLGAKSRDTSETTMDDEFGYSTRAALGSTNITLDSDFSTFYFSPKSSGYYLISTGGSVDTVGRLYNSSYVLLDENDDSGSGRNFQIRAYLYSGQTYYIQIRAYSGSNMSATLYIEED